MSALRALVWAPVAGLLAITLCGFEASAHGPGAGARAGASHGVSFGRGVGGANFSHGLGGASFSRNGAFRSFSSSHGSHTNFRSRSFSGNHSVGHTTATGSFSHTASFSHPANVTHAHQVFGHRVITNAAFHSAHVPFHFHGRFFGSPWPWWWGGIVIGWVGPVFWPYVYYDFFDYVFWPYAYDDFWPYAYDDVYYGIYGPYAHSVAPIPPNAVDPIAVSSAHQLAQSHPGVVRQQAQAQAPAKRAAEVCSNKASELAQWPIERISEVVQPTDAQRSALGELETESAKAIELLKEACPNDLPSIPTGRLAAMQSRLETMLAAVKAVHPALDRFYQSLSDEQKARFNAIADGQDSAAAKDQRDLAAFCNARAPGVTDLPIDRIATAVQPTESQRAALDALREASMSAAASLKADCPSYQVLTPVGRTEAMEQRLASTLTAVKTVEPALTKFYGLLSDEQKARFNTLPAMERPQG